MRDNNPKSPTYQEERITKTLDTSSCPVTPDDPQWIPDPNFDPYCETKIYEPSMLEGNTGKFIFQIIDDNSYSTTFSEYFPFDSNNGWYNNRNRNRQNSNNR